MKVVFIGGLTNGKIVYDYLKSNKYVDLGLVVTYPDDSNKPRHVCFPVGKNIFKSGKANIHLDEIKAFGPDLIIVSGWSELLLDELLLIPPLGVVGFHPSKLPFDRGRSVLAWQIEEGYSETALSMFYYNHIPDGGAIIGQEKISIKQNDYINDILDKIDDAFFSLMKAYFPLVRMGLAPRREQDLNVGNFRRLRTSKDSVINWDNDTDDIYNKVRAIAYPYPGAIGTIEGVEYKILKSKSIEFTLGCNEPSGTLIARLYDGSMVVKTRDGYLLVVDFVKIVEK